MEAAPVMSDMAARSPSATSVMRYYYTKRQDPSKRPCTFPARHGLLLLPPADGSPAPPSFTNPSPSSSFPVRFPPCANTTAGIEVGEFYEIDHGSLPPKSPTMLKEIRVVMVREKTGLGVIVSFPSLLSLREYFRMQAAAFVTGSGKRKLQGGHPELDEKFVMSTNQATRVLRRPVPESELNASRHLERFWVVAPRVYEIPTTHSESTEEDEEMEEPEGEEEEEDDEDSDKSKTDSWLQRALKSTEVLRWGVRRKVRYIARNRVNTALADRRSRKVAMKEESQDEVSDGKTRSRAGKRKNNNKKKKKTSSRKEMKKKKNKNKPPKLEVGERLSGVSQADRPKSSKDRWSTERYETAEERLLEIMREKGAVLGNPILRPHLREEARKHIGDTGLLDHLLKHMAGKVVMEGKVRFRRRHNPEGAMEYWLEDAKLAEIRRSVGVEDLTWAPPPGWEPGDGVPCCRPWGVELGQLKEELSGLRRELEQLQTLRKEQEEKESHLRNAETASTAAAAAAILQEGYEGLLEWKARTQDQLSEMVASLHDMKEELGQLKEEARLAKVKREEKEGNGVVVEAAAPGGEEAKKKRNETRVDVVKETSQIKSTMTTNATNSANNDDGVGGTGTSGKNSARSARRSGFRICKPQGTFLWPNMVGGVVASGDGTPTDSPKPMVVSYEDHYQVFGVPTPPSASSATSPPLLPLPQPPLTSRSSSASTSTSTTTVVVPNSAAASTQVLASRGNAGNTPSAQMLVVNHHHHHHAMQMQMQMHQRPMLQQSELALLGERTASSDNARASSHLQQQHSTHGVFPRIIGSPSTAQMGGGGWSSSAATISTDLALASPTYGH